MKKRKLGFSKISFSRKFATTMVNWIHSNNKEGCEFVDISKNQFAWTVEYKDFN